MSEDITKEDWSKLVEILMQLEKRLKLLELERLEARVGGAADILLPNNIVFELLK